MVICSKTSPSPLGNKTSKSIRANEALLWKAMHVDSLRPKPDKEKHVKITSRQLKYRSI